MFFVGIHILWQAADPASLLKSITRTLQVHIAAAIRLAAYCKLFNLEVTAMTQLKQLWGNIIRNHKSESSIT